MMKAPFCISVDNKWDRHISLPYRTNITLPDGRIIDKQAPCVEVDLDDIGKALQFYKERNQDKVNSILSKYF